MNHLGIFAKYWEPGKVKTRLARSLGKIRASQIYFTFFKHLLLRLSEAGEVRTVGFAPAEKHRAFAEEVGEAWGLTPQSDGQLGARMRDFFEWAHRENRQSTRDSERSNVILIGSDTPHLPGELIQRAFELLEEYPVVLGPSTDGGYYLLGMSESCYPIFDGINWSTDQVLSQTVMQLKKQGLRYALLEPLTDVDEYQHLKKLIERLREQSNTADSFDNKLLAAVEQFSCEGDLT